jgi:hypothetical protein
MDEFTAANATCRQELNRSCTAHIQTQHLLEREKRQHSETATILARQQCQLMAEQEARITAQQTLELERRRCQQIAIELDRTQRKFHLVDSLVDTMLLEEDSQLELSDRSRQITDVILDLEKRFEANYQDELERKDKCIEELENKLARYLKPMGDALRSSRSESVPPYLNGIY